MKCQQNSVTVEELTDEGSPSKLWDADLWVCPECGHHVIAGFAQSPIVEHAQAHYYDMRVRLLPIYVGRCTIPGG